MAKLAIKGGKPVREKQYANWPIFGDEEMRAAEDVLKSGRWAHIMSYPMLFGDNLEDSSKIEELSKMFAGYYGVEYALPVTNGTEALELALRNAGIGYGDEVVTTPTTWIAPALAAVMVGADPVFADIDPDTYCIDPSKIEEAITPKTRAIIPVHLGGNPCDMERIMAIANKHKLVVIEDCAQAHGTKINGKLVGSFGHFGCFSLELSKFMTAGEGGMMIGNYSSLGDNIYGFTGRSWKLIYEEIFAKGKRLIGWNGRMTEIQAAILIEQLKRIESHKSIRQKNAAHLTQRLSEIGGIELLKQAPDQNYYSFMFKYKSPHFKNVPKNVFMDAVTAEGIFLFSSASHQEPTYRNSFFYSPRRDYSKVFCPVAEKAFSEEAVGVQAVWMLLGDKKDTDDIADAIIKVIENIDELVNT